MEYSLVVTPVTVCVSRIFAGLLPFFGWSSDLWYVKVKGGSPVRVNTISAWSPNGALECYNAWAMCEEKFTLMNVLQYSLSISYQRGRQRVYNIVKIRHSSLTHCLLVSHRGDHELSWFVQSQRERGTLRLLVVRFAIDTIT